MLSLVLVVALMAVSLVACGESSDDPEQGGNQTDVKLDVDVSDADLQNLLGSGNVYLTTIGQADLSVGANLLDNAGYTVATEAGANVYVQDNMLNAADVPAGSTVFIMIGASSKGLGSAGTDEAKELIRANAFAAAKANINIVALHTGKDARRGATSDPSIEVVSKAAKVVLVVDDGKGNGGNYDGLFTRICSEANVPLYTYSKAAKMVNSVKYLLGIQA